MAYSYIRRKASLKFRSCKTELKLSEEIDSLRYENRLVEVVIPAYNEEKRIGRTLDALTVLPEVDAILVVFEGNDRTPEIARQYQKVRVLEAERRLGKGGR